MRVQELYSDEDRIPLGVVSAQNRRSVSDELYFNDGGSRHPRNYSDEHLAYGDRYESGEEESDEGESAAMVVMTRSISEEEAIAHRALERIERAKRKGKPDVTLTHEEIEALDKKYARESPERERKRSSPKGKRSPSTSNGAWTRKKGSRRSSLLSSAIAPPKQRSSKSSRPRDSPELSAANPQPPGLMVQGPSGQPVYMPIGYYAGQPPAVRRTASGENRYSPPESRGSSRSGSASSRHNPQALAPYPYYDAAPAARPTSRAVSMHSEPAEYAYAQYQTSGPVLAPSGRRVASGPPEASYPPAYRRVPVATSSVRGRMPMSSSDPNIQYAAERGANEYSDDDDDEDSEDELAAAVPVRAPRHRDRERERERDRGEGPRRRR